ncbi:MAG: GNAT family N-acetyltransferase [Candidatus Kariarchaeaceae archaeon]|jgi:hypothetical protein
MAFYPIHQPVPAQLIAEEFQLRPLLASDVEKDYEAVIATRERNLRISNGRWPKEGFTLEENLEDLQRHEKEQLERIAFTFTVMDPKDQLCLGCIYIKRPSKEMAEFYYENDKSTDYVAFLTYWLRPDYSSQDFEVKFLKALIGWMNEEWKFNQVNYYIGKYALEYEHDVLIKAGLKKSFDFKETSYFKKIDMLY